MYWPVCRWSFRFIRSVAATSGGDCPQQCVLSLFWKPSTGENSIFICSLPCLQCLPVPISAKCGSRFFFSNLTGHLLWTEGRSPTQCTYLTNSDHTVRTFSHYWPKPYLNWWPRDERLRISLSIASETFSALGSKIFFNAFFYYGTGLEIFKKPFHLGLT